MKERPRMGKSVTCPKCARVSTYASDILMRYCATCGYHDAALDTPHGIPGVSPKFRQPTPAMEFQALFTSFNGYFLNWVEGIIESSVLRVAYTRYRDDVAELFPHLENGDWIQPRQQPMPPLGGGNL